MDLLDRIAIVIDSLPIELADAIGAESLSAMLCWLESVASEDALVCNNTEDLIKAACFRSIIKIDIDIIYMSRRWQFTTSTSTNIEIPLINQYTADVLRDTYARACLAIPNHSTEPTHWIYYLEAV